MNNENPFSGTSQPGAQPSMQPPRPQPSTQPLQPQTQSQPQPSVQPQPLSSPRPFQAASPQIPPRPGTQFPPKAASLFPLQPKEPSQSTTPPMGENNFGPKKRNNVALIAILAVVLIAAIIAVVVFVFMPQGQGGGNGHSSDSSNSSNSSNSFSSSDANNGGNSQSNNSNTNETETVNISSIEIRNFCNRHNLAYEESSSDNLSLEISCMPQQSYADATGFIVKYGVFGESKRNETVLAINSLFPEKIVLENSDNYTKMYIPGDASSNVYTYSYVIIDKDSCLVVASESEAAVHNALLEIGYPDSNWVTTEEQESLSSSSTAVARRDAQRRNDISHMDTSIVQYQINNAGGPPTGPSYWAGSLSLECGDNVSCNFIKSYLNTYPSSGTNSFIDPDGTPYGVYITENWSSNGSISPTFGNEFSYLVPSESGDSYTIGGSSSFSQHIMYIIPGAMCQIGATGVVQSTERHFAIMYILENGATYCLDDQ